MERFFQHLFYFARSGLYAVSEIGVFSRRIMGDIFSGFIIVVNERIGHKQSGLKILII